MQLVVAAIALYLLSRGSSAPASSVRLERRPLGRSPSLVADPRLVDYGAGRVTSRVANTGSARASSVFPTVNAETGAVREVNPGQAVLNCIQLGLPAAAAGAAALAPTGPFALGGAVGGFALGCGAGVLSEVVNPTGGKTPGGG